MIKTAIIVGGSIAGLFAALALQQTGWQVQVLERTGRALAGRGAGIVTHPELLAALRQVGASTDNLGVTLSERVAYDLQGNRVKSINYDQIVTSWDRLYQILSALLSEDDYLLASKAARFSQGSDGVEVALDDGRTLKADLLVGADGFNSAVRQRFWPEVTPSYAGYVVWRTLAQQADLPKDIQNDIFKTMGIFAPNGTQLLGYPIAGANNDLRNGHLRYNFVCYAPADQGQLADMLTDETGQQHRATIPPPLIRADIINQMRDDALTRLPEPFNRILAVSERPFFTPIYDHCSPVMGAGRVALVGDAACVARPHAGMGVTKATYDALALARHLKTDLSEAAMRAFSEERAAASQVIYQTARMLGGLIFDGPSDQNQDGRSHPQLLDVMEKTASVPT